MKCHECERKIQKVIFDRCMYCGAEILEELKPSAIEKEQLISRQKYLKGKSEQLYRRYGLVWGRREPEPFVSDFQIKIPE